METGDDVVTTWRTAAATYETELARARKAGILLPSDVRKKPLPPAQNAAGLYRRMAAIESKRSAAHASTEMLLELLTQHTPTQIHLAQQAAVSSPDLRLAHQAAALPHCDFERSPGGPIPELSALRQTARLLAAESLLLVYQGKAKEAVRNQALVFRVVRHAAAGNMLIDWLVALAVDAIALAGMARILTARPSDAAMAAAIAQTLEQEWQPLALAPVFAAEAALQQKELTRVRQTGFLPYLLHSVDETFAAFPGDTPAEKAESERDRRQARAEVESTLKPATLRALRSDRTHEALLLDASAAFMVRWMRKLYAASDQPYPRAKSIFAAFRRDLETPPSLPDGPRAIRLIPAHLMMTLASPLESKTYETARARALLAAARLLAQRGASPASAFPNTVAHLPPDPFHDGPLRYRKEGSGFVIFSVGPEGNFDGGRPGVRLVGQKSGLLFRYSPEGSG